MFRRTSGSRVGRGAAANSFDEEFLNAEIHDWVTSQRPLLGDLLLRGSLIEPEDLTGALREQRDRGGRLGDILLQALRIDEHQLAAALARQFQIPLADLVHDRPDPEALELVDAELARKHHVVPLHVVDGRVEIVTADPLNVESIRELTERCQRIALLIGTWTDIQRTIDTCYDELRDAHVHIQAFELTDSEGDASTAGDTTRIDEDAPVVQVVNRIITQGVRRGASDVHIEPRADDVRVRFRIDGVLTEVIDLPVRMGAPLASRIKVMSELNIVERRRPQDGQMSLQIDGRPVDIRTSIVPTIHGEKIVLRLLDKTRSLLRLSEMGMPDGVIAKYLRLVRAPLGMVLCTGPTGSGKTTTLYASLLEVNQSDKNVMTIEDPVEYQFDGVNQIQVSEMSGLTFADGLRGTLRQDPDVILLGEIRDRETAGIAMQAALTGHLVLSSLHALDAAAALHRFMDMGLEPFLVASAVNGVIGQRLVRRICTSCRTRVTPPQSHIRLVRAHVGSGDLNFAVGQGCNLCGGSGFRGRIGVYEFLVMNDHI